MKSVMLVFVLGSAVCCTSLPDDISLLDTDEMVDYIVNRIASHPERKNFMQRMALWAAEKKNKQRPRSKM